MGLVIVSCNLDLRNSSGRIIGNSIVITCTPNGFMIMVMIMITMQKLTNSLYHIAKGSCILKSKLAKAHFPVRRTLDL